MNSLASLTIGDIVIHESTRARAMVMDVDTRTQSVLIHMVSTNRPVFLSRFGLLAWQKIPKTSAPPSFRLGYIAGPMTGHPRANHDIFDRVAEWLRQRNWCVVSPAEHDRRMGFSSELWPTGSREEIAASGFPVIEAIRWDLGQLISPHMTDIVMLPGWESSRGASLEHAVAKAVGLRVNLIIENASSSELELVEAA